MTGRSTVTGCSRNSCVTRSGVVRCRQYAFVAEPSPVLSKWGMRVANVIVKPRTELWFESRASGLVSRNGASCRHVSAYVRRRRRHSAAAAGLRHWMIRRLPLLPRHIRLRIVALWGRIQVDINRQLVANVVVSSEYGNRMTAITGQVSREHSRSTPV